MSSQLSYNRPGSNDTLNESVSPNLPEISILPHSSLTSSPVTTENTGSESTSSSGITNSMDENHVQEGTTSQPTTSPSTESSNGSTTESVLRQQILQIHRDKTLSDSERSRRIQHLITGGTSSRTARTGPKPISVFNLPGDIRDEEKIPMFHDEEKTVFGCKHYMRSVKLQAHCCGKWVVCRFCHDEVSDHAIVRQKTRLMMCMRCFTVQQCSQFCNNIKCKVRVSRYYCSDCKLWDDDNKKNIYHCPDCGICRIGRGLGQDYFHCRKCNVCMAILLRDRHKCIERNLESDCPICGEYMFTSTTTVIFMPCGHCIHHRCYQEHIQTSYTCPTCCRSLGNMREYFARIDAAISSHKMPPELENQMSLIFCNDCEQRSVTNFHFMFHKCKALASSSAHAATFAERDIITAQQQNNLLRQQRIVQQQRILQIQQQRLNVQNPENLEQHEIDEIAAAIPAAINAVFGGLARTQQLDALIDSSTRICGSFNTRLVETFQKNTPQEETITARLAGRSQGPVIYQMQMGSEGVSDSSLENNTETNTNESVVTDNASDTNDD